MQFSKSEFEEWLSHPITEALLEDVEDAASELSYSLVYEKDIELIRVTQGMIRAYMDVAAVIEEGDFLEAPKGRRAN